MLEKENTENRPGKKISWHYSSGQNNPGFPWGPHKIPLQMEFAGVSLFLEKKEGRIIYFRQGMGEEYSKEILAEKGSFVLTPVEPFHLPVGVGTHLLIDFSRSVVIEPRSSKTVFATFPLELACAITHKQAGEHILDVFALSRPKFTLYGSIRNGLVCKYWKSDTYISIPRLNPLEQGVISINIQNSSGRWTEINKAVFSAPGMKIYYGPELVSLKASMKISNEYTAETVFFDEPLKKGMHKALEKFSQRFLSLSAKTVMEEGY